MPAKNEARLADYAAATMRDARQQADLSLREAARRAGTSHATLLAYETGTKSPSIVTYLRVLEACGYAVDIVRTRRVRERDGLARADELAEVLRLAEAFPSRMTRHLELPVFPSRG
jgi:transcriptional regulator with XRE-family HTH domain